MSKKKPEKEIVDKDEMLSIVTFAITKRIGEEGLAEVIQLNKLMIGLSEITTPELFQKLLGMTSSNLVSLFNILSQEQFTKEELLTLLLSNPGVEH